MKNEKLIAKKNTNIYVSDKKNTIASYIKEQGNLSGLGRFFQTENIDLQYLKDGSCCHLIPKILPEEGQQYVFEVDLDRCTGCRACVTGCHNLNGLSGSETWRNVGFIHKVTGKSIKQFITSSCHHCADPDCLKGCPVKAYEKDKETGIVKHLDDQCIGCQYCLWKCPYGAPQYNAKKGIVRKCDMCSNRLKGGEAPGCVQSCPNQAIKISIEKKNDIKSLTDLYSSLPGLPDPKMTNPSTKYKTGKFLPASMKPADHLKTEKDEPHIPLVLMLVLTQMAAGMIFFSTMVDSYFSHSMDTKLSASIFPVATVIILISLMIGGLHLGRPAFGFRAFLGVKNSWLSREVIAFGGFLSLAFLGSIFFLQDSGVIKSDLINLIFSSKISQKIPFLASLSGAFAVFCSAMLYVDSSRVPWVSPITTFKFMLTAVSLGACSIVVCILVFKREPETLLIGSFFLILSVTVLIKLLTEGLFFLYDNGADFSDHKKSTKLLKYKLTGSTVCRYSFGVIGGIFLPTALLLIGYESFFKSLIIVSSGILFFTVIGEGLERYLFFRSAIPSKMPGDV